MEIKGQEEIEEGCREVKSQLHKNKTNEDNKNKLTEGNKRESINRRRLWGIGRRWTKKKTGKSRNNI